MLICIDIGNTNIVIGCYDGETQIFQSRISTNTALTSDEYAVSLHGILNLHSVAVNAFDGAVVSSVVPALTRAMANAIETVTGIRPLSIDKLTKTGLHIVLDNPDELGGDLIAAAVAAKSRYPLPCIVLDLGTATTMMVLAANGDYLGGAIVPGLKVSLDALVSRTSMLVGISLDAPKQVIGANTVDSMKSGVIFGYASLIDGMCARIADQLGAKPTVVATGGLSNAVIPHCNTAIVFDDNLLMDGLRLLYEMNT